MWIAVGIIFLLVCGFVWILSLPDEVQPVDNSDKQIICGNTNKPCIRDTLYSYWNNCGDCPYYECNEENKNKV